MEKGSENWAEHVAAAKRDPVSMVEYAKRHRIDIATLRYWSCKLNKQKRALTVGAEAVPGKFVALQVEEVACHDPGLPVLTFTLVLSGMTLTMPSLPAPEWLAALGHAVQGAR